MERSLPKKPVEILSGLVERVTYFNEENGFCVLRVKAKGKMALVTVVGSTAAVSAGEWVEAEGSWVQDRDHGLQFKAANIRTAPPGSIEGITRYLGSGLIKGVGPVLADRLVGEFGDRVLQVIDQSPRALERVEGIGPTRRERIKQAWDEAKHVREIMVFLHSCGVSTSRAVRIYRTYGENAVEIVRDDPYTLARDIHGIGFRSADQIAGRLGIPQDSVKRVAAGLGHVLLEATDEGHCALPVDLLKQRAVELLQVPQGNVEQVLLDLATQGSVCIQEVEASALAFLPHLLFSEREIARRVRILSGAPPNYPPIDIAKAVDWCRQKTGIELAASQRQALEVVLRSRCAIITGGPGVGKTTLIRSVLAILAAKGVKPLLCAPTGRAAKRLGEATGLEAKTIHRLLEAQASGRFLRQEKNPLEGDLVVVDEVSMVDVSLMQALLRACPPKAGLILVGDVDQLPSVGPGMVLRDLIESEVVPVVRLTEVFRQAAGSNIIKTAHLLRQGVVPSAEGKDQASDFFFLERDEPDKIRATLEELVQKRIPSHLRLDPVRDIQVLCPMNRGTVGVRELNTRLQELLNPERQGEATVERFGFRFRAKDKVIQTENNYDKDVFNGDVGLIRKVDPVQHELIVDFEGRSVAYEFDELDQLSLAYAITIHKSQGSEFRAVVIPLAMEQYVLLQRNLVYTALTRGRSMVVIVGQRKALGMAVRNSRVAKRYSGLFARLRGTVT